MKNRTAALRLLTKTKVNQWTELKNPIGPLAVDVTQHIASTKIFDDPLVLAETRKTSKKKL